MGARKNTLSYGRRSCASRNGILEDFPRENHHPHLPAVLDFYFLCQIKVVLERGFGSSLVGEHFSSSS